MNIIITSLNSWENGSISNVRILAEQLSIRHNVLFVDIPIEVMAPIKGFCSTEIVNRMKIYRKPGPALRRMNNNLWLFTPPIAISAPGNLFSEMMFDMVNRRNNRRLAREILWAMERLKMSSDFIHINDNDIFSGFYLKELLMPKLSIYYRRDNLPALPYWNRNGVRLEPRLAHKSDAVVTCSESLAAGVRAYNYKTFNIGQGVNLHSIRSLMERFLMPRDMNGIRGPIVGYVGNLASLYTSANTIHRFAREHPRVSVVLVGSEDSSFSSHTLHMLPNVFFLGAKNNDQIACYVRHFDVFVNPIAINELTEVNYNPVVDIALAMGKPVVSMRNDPMTYLSGYVHLADSEEDFSRAVTLALREVDSYELAEERRSFAESLSIEHCAERFYAVVEYLEEELRMKKGIEAPHSCVSPTPS